ncbi:hypothetical protein [Streptomyces sp. PSAA01]|uniref:hypothetical protein n=1 Tax=Streptomyces sp. PSAA01 TaxID=2912762 RepID=UPI001F1B9962|nr:hypothetical protein [Streptomyces sp. PSAA01]MCG0285384.1 hypothetical protein [Streptomyces sp. PSAA01]
MSDDTRTAAPSPEDALRSARLLARAEAAVMALFATRAYELGWTVRSKLSGIMDHVTLSCDAGHSTQVTPVTALHPKLGSTIVRAPEGSVFLLDAGTEHMAVPGTPNLAAFPMALEACEDCARKRWEEAARASFAAYAIDTDLRILADATSPNGYPAKEVRCLHGHEFTITAMDPRTPKRVPGYGHNYGREYTWRDFTISATDSPTPRGFPEGDYRFTTGSGGAGDPCVTCVSISKTPKLVEFRRRAREQNVMILDVMSDRIAQTVRLCCVAGHLTSVGINSGLKRELLCARCSGAGIRPEPTVYYVVTNGAMVKPGISSGDGRGRLDTHRSEHGLGQVRRLITDLPVGAARDVERHVLDCLAGQDIRPVMGSEYFDAAHIDRVLELADGWFAANLPNSPWTVTA